MGYNYHTGLSFNTSAPLGNQDLKLYCGIDREQATVLQTGIRTEMKPGINRAAGAAYHLYVHLF